MSIRSEKITATGNIGERLVLEYLRDHEDYDSVVTSTNKYDMHKDLIAQKSGKSVNVECKTRTVIRKHYAMPLGVDQWYKADNADRLFFISNPTSPDEPINIYESNKQDFFVLDNFGPRGQRTRMYDLGKMKKVKTIKDPALIQEMYNLSVSNYKQ